MPFPAEYSTLPDTLGHAGGDWRRVGSNGKLGAKAISL